MSDTLRFDVSLPRPYKENWRLAYRYEEDDAPRLSSYQAPDKNPIPFILEHISLNTGQSVDTAEYPFFGLWSNTPLNEKPQTISVRGYIRGPEYIKNRNALAEALRIKTSDDTPGFLDLPLWGRFSVVVIDTSIEEDTAKNGQCSVSINFTRAGVTETARWEYADDGFDFYKKTETSGEKLQAAAVSAFETLLKTDGDGDTISSGFTSLKDRLLGVVGRIQGAQSVLNVMTNEVVEISNLLAQGIRSPKTLANALFGAAAGIVAGILEIKNSLDETIAFFTIKDNQKNILMQFLSETNVTLEIEAITVKQQTTKAATLSLYKTVAFCTAGQLLVTLDNNTYQQTQNYWQLFQQLGNSINQEDPSIYQAVRDMCIAASQELSARGLDAEYLKNVTLPAPLLYLSKYLGTDDERIRQLNIMADSFVIEGTIIYV